MGGEQPADEAPQPQIERARIYLHTGQYVDVAILPIPSGWQMLIANILQNRGFMTEEMWIPEPLIKLVVRNPGAETDPNKIGGGNVVQLRPLA